MKLSPRELAVALVSGAVITVAAVFAFNGVAPRTHETPFPQNGVPVASVPAEDFPATAGTPLFPALDALPPPPEPIAEPVPAEPIPAQSVPARAAAPVKAPRPAIKSFSCAGQICIDADSGEILSARNEYKQHQPASVTKLMTIFLVLDAVDAGKLQLDDPVIASRRAQDMGGTQVNLAAGEIHSVDDLLYALMLQSANDAAVALAEKVSGSVENFVDAMNAKARELALTRTTFSTPHGLPMSKKERPAGEKFFAKTASALSRFPWATTTLCSALFPVATDSKPVGQTPARPSLRPLRAEIGASSPSCSAESFPARQKAP